MKKQQAEDDAIVPWAEADTPSELRDDADDFEDALIAEMRGRGVVDVL